MAFFFLFMASLNFGLGFALAIYLAPYLTEADAVAAPAHAGALPREITPIVASAGALAAPAPAAEAAVPDHAPEEPAGPALLAVEDLEPQAPAKKPEPAPAAAPVETNSPGAIETSIAEFKTDLDRYREQLGLLDARLRSNTEELNPAALQACVGELLAANAKYLEQQTSAAEQLLSSCGTADLGTLGDQLDKALGRQATELQTSYTQLNEVDWEENLLFACQQLLDETARLVDTHHAVRDLLDEVELQVGRQGDLPAALAKPPADPVHNLVSRIQLEAALAAWWAEDPQRELPLSLGMVDLDQLRAVNETHGLLVGDRILKHVGKLVGGRLRDKQRAARMGAQRFLLLVPGLPAQDSSNLLEHIRQGVAATRFEHNGVPIQVTVSCGLVEGAPTDTATALIDRLLATISEAKRQGHNRTWVHDGRTVSQVIAPELSIETCTVSI